MARYNSATRFLGCAAALATVILVSAAAAQTTKSVPNLAPDGASWGRGNGVNFEPVPGSPPFVTNDPAHPYYGNAAARRAGVSPTYRIADLTNPNLKQWAKDVMKKDNDEVLAGKPAYTPSSSCKPPGVPVYMLDGGPFHFLQLKDKIIIWSQGLMRRVYLDVPHSQNPKPSWYGESVGHYDGDALVIDTIGFNTKTFVDQFRTPHTEKLHTIERWSMTDGGKGIKVEVTVEDPDTFVQPWKGAVSYNLVKDDVIEEYSCADGNMYDPVDWGIPKDDTPDF